MKKKIRLSFNYLFDEFVFDKEQKDNNKGNARAFSIKSLYRIYNNNNTILNCYISSISVGTYTFKHENGYNNFVQRNHALGWNYGSDSREIKFGLSGLYNNRIIFNVDIGKRQIGEKNILNNPYNAYTDFLDVPFPSGIVEEVVFGLGKLQWWYKPNLSLIAKIDYNKSNFFGNNIEWNIGADIFYQIDKKL